MFIMVPEIKQIIWRDYLLFLFQAYKVFRELYAIKFPSSLFFSINHFISYLIQLQARLQQYVNFQMFKLVLEKAEEPDIKLPTSTGSSKKQESSRKHLILLYWLCQRLWLCGSQ